MRLKGQISSMSYAVKILPKFTHRFIENVDSTRVFVDPIPRSKTQNLDGNIPKWVYTEAFCLVHPIFGSAKVLSYLGHRR